jgi:hypothetical protein
MREHIREHIREPDIEKPRTVTSMTVTAKYGDICLE